MSQQENVKIVVTAEDKASGKLKNLFGTITGGVAVGNLLANAITSAGRSLVEFGKESVNVALTVDRLGATLPGLAKNAGRTEKEVNALVKAIRDENKSMKEARTIAQGIILADLKQADALKLLAMARNVGASVGASSAVVNETILQSMLQLNPTMLKSVGISVMAKDAYLDQAEALGKNVADLTTAEKQQAIFNATMDQGWRFAGQYNDAMNTTQKIMNSVKDAFEDVRFVVGKLLSDGFFPIVEFVLKSGIRSFRSWAFTADNELNPVLTNLSTFISTVLLTTFQFFINTVRWLITTFQELKVFLEDIGFIETMREAWNRVSKEFQENLLPQLKELWVAMQPLIKVVLELAGVALVALVVALQLVIPIITDFIVKIMDWVASFMEVVTTIHEFLAPAINFISDTLRDFMGVISQVVSSLDRLIEKVGQALAKVRELKGQALGSFTAGLKSIFVPGKAVGGPVTKNRAFKVGENGPEIFVPNQSGNILPNSAGVGGAGVVVNITGNQISDNVDVRALADKVGKEIVRVLKLQRRI